VADLLDIQGNEQSIGDLSLSVVAQADAARKGNTMQNAIEPARHEGRIVRAEDAPMVAMIERIVMDPSIPIDRLERMLEMKERMEDRAREDEERQAKKAYFAAMSACQKALPVVTKNQNNTHTRSRYADLAAIEEQAMPIIHDHGFAVSFQPDGYNEKGELKLLWEISHSEGHSRSGIGEIPIDNAGSQGKVNKTGTQAFGSTATYGRRYLLCMLFNISTGDDRDGNQPPEPEDAISQDQLKELRELIEQTGADIEKFCSFYRIEALPDLPASKFEHATTSIQRAAEKRRAVNA
jgi:hypothetical protein